MGGRHYTPEEDRVIRLNAGVIPAKEIGQKIGRTRQSTCERARLIGVSLQLHGERHHLAKYSDAQVEAVRSLHEQGVPVGSITSQTGVKPSSVKRIAYFQQRLHRARAVWP
jgi:hypothetical protein